MDSTASSDFANKVLFMPSEMICKQFCHHLVPRPTVYYCSVLVLLVKWSTKVSATADRPARRSVKGPPCCTQMSDGQCDKRVTHDRHQFTTLMVHLSWQRVRWSAFQIYGWCPPKFKWFTWPDHAPLRDGLPSVG